MRLKERKHASEVVAVSLGPKASQVLSRNLCRKPAVPREVVRASVHVTASAVTSKQMTRCQSCHGLRMPLELIRTTWMRCPHA